MKVKVPLIQKLSENYAPIEIKDWGILEGMLTPKKVMKKQLFLREGDSSDQFAIIADGIFRLYFVHEDGKEFTKTFKKSGDVMGCLAEHFLGIPSRIHIEAVVDSEILVGSVKEFEKLTQSDIEWERVLKNIILDSYIDKEQREFEFLQLPAMERYKNFMKKFSEISVNLPKNHIASYLGITPVAFSRLLAQLNKGDN